MAGFRRYVQTGITLLVNEDLRVDIAMAIGELTDSVTVTGESTGVDTRSTATGEVIDRTTDR